jgi:hypothetical protein
VTVAHPSVARCIDNRDDPDTARYTACDMPDHTPRSGASRVTTGLSGALTFHAGFDHGPDAAFGSGDRRLYTAAEADQYVGGLTPGLGTPPLSIAEGRGKFGAALEFTQDVSHVVVYKAESNVAYSSDRFQGTVSFWLNLDPAEIPGRYSDPFQLTDKKFSDACIWVDFTKNDVPSEFRLGMFGDLAAWDIAGAESQSAEFYQRLAKIAEPPFAKGQWTHVAVTWNGLNTPEPGRARLYLNGAYRGATSRIPEQFTWDIGNVGIRLGMGHFVGLVDDLAVFNRPLTLEEVGLVYELRRGVAELYD